MRLEVRCAQAGSHQGVWLNSSSAPTTNNLIVLHDPSSAAAATSREQTIARYRWTRLTAAKERRLAAREAAVANGPFDPRLALIGAGCASIASATCDAACCLVRMVAGRRARVRRGIETELTPFGG